MKILKKLKQKKQEMKMKKDLEIRLTLWDIANHVNNAIKNNTDTVIFEGDSNDKNLYNILTEAFLGTHWMPGLYNEFVVTFVDFDMDKTTMKFKIVSDKGACNENINK